MRSPVSCPASSRSRPVPADAASTRWLAVHVWWPLGAGFALVALLQSGYDLRLADWVFRLEGGNWAWRDAAWLEFGVHRVGRAASIAAWLALAVAWRATPRTHARKRQATAYVLVAVALATLSVSLLKAASGIDCPWDLARYGGTRAWHPLFDPGASGAARGRCFPAGHASAGYAWLALYFAARHAAPRRARAALWIALGAGLVFGLGQQLRGAHFASHDVASALACWLVALALWRAWPWTHAPATRGDLP